MYLKRFFHFILLGNLFLLLSCSKNEGIKHQTFEKADALIAKALDDSIFTGAVLLVGSTDSILHEKAYGYATLYDSAFSEISVPDVMTTEHLFDLASLTKVLATTYGLMALHSEGAYDIDDPVAQYIPEFKAEGKDQITIEHLLRHTSGLIPWHPSYYVAKSAQERLEWISEYPLNSKPGEDRRYSDFGFMVLGDLVEVLSGKSLERYLEDDVYRPLGLHSTLFNPDISRFPNVVSTSHGNPFEKKMVHDDDFGYTIDIDPDSWSGWRTYTLKGEVNDGNAWYTHGGVAGHAGLFSNTSEIYSLLQVLLNNGTYNGRQIMNPETIELFLTPDQNGQSLGWITNNNWIHGKNLPENSFGHTGFTGTNLVVSPDTDRLYVLLTNRQHGGPGTDGSYPDLRPLREKLTETLLH
jgi:CubicO group peptidase (beta-lactamase class C family)